MIKTEELMRFVKATILSDLYVELSREWEDEDTEQAERILTLLEILNKQKM